MPCAGAQARATCRRLSRPGVRSMHRNALGYGWVQPSFSPGRTRMLRRLSAPCSSCCICPRPECETLPPERTRPTILIVDDEPRNLVALGAALASLKDCSVVQAHSGRDALRCLLAQDFAVVVLAVHMPGIGGFETARLIQIG